MSRATTSTSKNSQETMICLEELLSSCIDASLQGCHVIRKYKQDNETVCGVLKEAGEIKSVMTQADVDAQHVIVHGLRRIWGDQLTIVGEEDDSQDSPTTATTTTSFLPLRTNLLQGILLPTTCTTKVPIHEVTLFVDPLDGTREFVEGRLQNVGCLVGVARKGRAIMGAVGLPFPSGRSEPKILYAIHMDENDVDPQQQSHHGTYPIDTAAETTAHRPQPTHDDSITVFTGDSKDPVLQNATELALTMASAASPTGQPAHHTILGGTTSKFVAVAQKERSLAILHFKTCYWDTCAPEPVLHALGGKVTDFFGSPLVHTNDKRYNYGNLWGVVASSPGMHDVHDAICAGMRADMESVQRTLGPWWGTIPTRVAQEPQAVDISRDLDGHPLTCAWLQERLLRHQEHDNQAWSLTGYGVPESDAVRGLMSQGARLVLDWKSVNNKTEGKPPPPASIFYKRVVMRDLDHARAKLVTAPHKVLRDVYSYQVETNFLESRACQKGLLREAGVHVCKCYGSSKELPADGCHSPRQQLESKFCMILEDFNEKDGWYQEWLLEETTGIAVLQALANMHAYFWVGSNFWDKEGGKLGQELEEVVWPNGGYMQPALQGYEQLETVATGWTHRLAYFQDELSKVSELEGVDLENLGARVEKLARKVGTRAHPFAELAKTETADLQAYRTLIHGDPKQANLFFRRGDADLLLQVGFIDFQWCGFGLAATDVAHFISAALQPHCLSRDGKKEEMLLDHYHFCLAEALVKHGVARSTEDVENRIYPRQTLQDHYEVAFLDVCRMVFAYAWSRWKPETEPTPSSFHRNAYNKSLASVLWLITRCSAVLDKRETDLLQVP